MPRPLLALLALLVACESAQTPAPAPAPPRRTRPPAVVRDPVRERLERLARALDAAPRSCKKTCCFDRLFEPLLPMPGQARSLRAIVKEARSPRLRALAIRMLSVGGLGPRDVPLIEAYAASVDKAWSAPWSQAFMQQRVVPCPAVTSWRPVTLGRVALDALGSIMGQQRVDLATYRRWRGLHPDVRDALSYWQRHFPLLVATFGCKGALRRLARRGTGVLLRLVVALHHRYPNPRPTCPRPEQLLPFLNQKRLLALLQRPQDWRADPDPSYAEDTDWERFALWVLAGAEALLEQEAADALLALQGSDRLRGVAAVAAGRLAPGRRAQILQDAAASLRVPPPELARALARALPASSHVSGWLRAWKAEPCGMDRLAEATLEGLALAGKPGKATIRRWLARERGAWKKRPVVVRALAGAALALGAPKQRLACRERLHRFDCLKLTRQARTRLRTEAAQALITCVDELGRYFGR